MTTLKTFEGQEIPFNLHEPIRNLVSERDKLLEELRAVAGASYLDISPMLRLRVKNAIKAAEKGGQP